MLEIREGERMPNEGEVWRFRLPGWRYTVKAIGRLEPDGEPVVILSRGERDPAVWRLSEFLRKFDFHSASAG